MKIKNSLKAMKARHRDNQLVSPQGPRLHHQQDRPALQGTPGLSFRPEASLRPLIACAVAGLSRQIQFDVPPPGTRVR